MNTKLQDSTFNVLKYNLTMYLPIRVVLRNENGKLRGLVEESFSMGFSDSRVRIWWSGLAYSMLGEHDINAIEDATHNAASNDLVIDPLADDSPIEIDWPAWLNATDKFGKRNAPFKMRDLE